MARILLLDDSRTVLGIVGGHLREAGHEVYEASDGKLGLALFFQSHPDLVISDVVMPEMDGFEILRAIRATDPTTPMILMSGGGHALRVDDLLRTARFLGAWQVLRKPFSGEKLLQVVQGALAGGSVPVDGGLQDA